MGTLFDFLSGGNAKVAAAQLVKLHKLYNGNFALVYSHYIVQIANQCGKTEKLGDLEMLLSTGQIVNYVDLLALDLNLNAAPKNVKFSDTLKDFKAVLQKHLIAGGIDLKFMYENNLHLVESVDLQ